MAIRLGLTSDVDLAPLCFPWEAGWVLPPTGVTISFKPLADLERALLAGELDIAPVGLLAYVKNQTRLRVMPTPVRASEIASDSVFLISQKRLDLLDQARVAISPASQTGEALLKLIAPAYYGLTPDSWPAPSEAAALEALQGNSQMCVLTGEVAMRSAGWAKAKGYFVEDLTKAWWITTGSPLPLYLFAVREDWLKQDNQAAAICRDLMLIFRRAIQISNLEQRSTLLSQAETRTGLPADALDQHFRSQRYELNEGHLRGLLEFYRRLNAAGLAPALQDLTFFPSLSPVAPAPAGPPRRTITETERVQAVRSRPKPESEEEAAPNPAKRKKPSSRRSEAQARGLRIIKGGKDRSPQYEGDEED